MSAEIPLTEPFDPDRIPTINGDMLDMRQHVGRQTRRQGLSLQWKEDKQDHIKAYTDALRNPINENLGRLSLSAPLDDETLGIISMLVAVQSEKPADLEATFSSLERTIDTSYSDGSLSQALVMPWLNYTADPRREHLRSEELRSTAQAIAKRAISTFTHDDPRYSKTKVAAGIHQTPRGTTISQLRNCALQATLGVLEQKVTSEMDVPYVLLDADTTLSTNALTAIKEALDKGKSLFVTGTLHHVGGVMDLPLDRLYFADTGSKMLYITEMLRRTMLDHLPPHAPRGYPAESGLAMRLDTLVNLGGYDVKIHNNESYDLLSKAERALTVWFDPSTFRNTTEPRSGAKVPDHKPFPEPYVNLESAERITSLVQYADYIISTSIRGYETAIRRHGIQVLGRFDQGFEYELYTHTPEADHEGPLSTEPLSLEKAIELLNRSYSYFEDCGGVLLAKDLGNIERLIYMCFAERYADAPSPYAVWRPEYIPKEQR